MSLLPARTEHSFLELGIDGTVDSIESLLEAQKKLFHSQVDQLQRLVVTQCKLTGINPLSQEMAAGALLIKIGKKPRDLLNPKAVKYMQSIFAIKDTIGKKETREISALCGVTATQVKDFFSGQRSKVRKVINLVRERVDRSDTCNATNVELSTNPEATLLYGSYIPSSAPDINKNGVSAEDFDSNGNLSSIQHCKNVPVNLIEDTPGSMVLYPSSLLEDSIPAIDGADKMFAENNIINLMRKEEMFSGQVKLMEWILQIHNSAALDWFLSKGCLIILAAWLSQAAIEEQTTVLNVILKVLCHLSLHKALPAQMSTVLQTVNKLRFYRAPDISNRARVLLSKWSKMLLRNQAQKYPSILNSSNGVQKDIIRKQRISEILSDEFWRTKIGITEEILALAGNAGDESKQAFKLLEVSCENSCRKQGQSASSVKIKERRQVLLVEQFDQKPAGRIATVKRARSRPTSADDIQKEKMRAIFMQHKYGKVNVSAVENKKLEGSKCLRQPQPKRHSPKRQTPMPRMMPLAQEHKNKEKLAQPLPDCSETPAATMSTEAFQEELLERLKRDHFIWRTPPEMKIDSSWLVIEAEGSKEIYVQAQRIRREKETLYSSKSDISLNPKEPWDIEIDFDDSLTPEIPVEQQPDADASEESIDPIAQDIPAVLPMESFGFAAAPDLELLAVLLQNPELVFALTSGEGKNLTSEERVALLDMIKHSSSTMNAAASQEKLKEPEPISLPSPTPPSDAERAICWRSAFSAMDRAQLSEIQLSAAAQHPNSTLSPAPIYTSSTTALPKNVELSMSQVIMPSNTTPQPIALSSQTQMPSSVFPQHALPSGSNPLPRRMNSESSTLLLKDYAVSNPTVTTSPFLQESYGRSRLQMSLFSPAPSRPPPQERLRPSISSDTSIAPILMPLPPLDIDTEQRDTLPEYCTRPRNAMDYSLSNQCFDSSVGVYKDYYPTHTHQSTKGGEDVGRYKHCKAWREENSSVRSSDFRHGLGQSLPESRREHGLNQRSDCYKLRSSGHGDQHHPSRERWHDKDRRR